MKYGGNMTYYLVTDNQGIYICKDISAFKKLGQPLGGVSLKLLFTFLLIWNIILARKGRLRDGL